MNVLRDGGRYGVAASPDGSTRKHARRHWRRRRPGKLLAAVTACAAFLACAGWGAVAAAAPNSSNRVVVPNGRRLDAPLRPRAARIRPAVRPTLRIRSNTLRWTAIAGAGRYIVASAALGSAAKYHGVRGTSYTPPANRAKTVRYRVRTDRRGSPWSNTVVRTYRATATALAFRVSGVGHRIVWSRPPGATSFTGAISAAARGATARTTSYVSLGNVTGWTPPASCGQTLYYGVATSTGLWSSSEMSITWPACGGTGGGGSVSSMVVGVNAEDWGGYPGVGGKSMGQDIATLTPNIRWDDEASGSDLNNYYLSQGLKASLLINQYNGGGVSAMNASSYASGAVSTYQANCPQGVAQCPYVEVLNEPYGTWYNGSNAESTANAGAYATMVVDTYNAFHSKYGPNSPKILAYTFLGCSNGSAVGCSSAWTSGVTSAVPNIANYYDGVIVHPYGGGSGYDRTLSAQGNRNAVTSAHQATGKPVYVTEVGWPTNTGGSATGDSQQWTEAQQATNIYNFVNWARSTGYVGGVWYYAYMDDAAPGWYGLVRHSEGSNDWTHKPGWTALGQAINQQSCTVCG